MSDDLVKRYSSYNIMMLGDSGNEVSTPDGEWVKYKDYKAQADRIEELEEELEYWREEADLGWDKAEERRAELEIALEALEKLARLGNGDHYGNSEGNMIARNAIAVLKGETEWHKK